MLRNEKKGFVLDSRLEVNDRCFSPQRRRGTLRILCEPLQCLRASAVKKTLRGLVANACQRVPHFFALRNMSL
jgi:hypothetical protein